MTRLFKFDIRFQRGKISLINVSFKSNLHPFSCTIPIKLSGILFIYKSVVKVLFDRYPT